MTFLELCQEVIDDAGLSGSISTVTDQRGDYGRVVSFVRNACLMIESKWINWRFLWGRHTFAISKDTAIYPAPESIRLRQWRPKTAFLDGQPLNVQYYDEYIRWMDPTFDTTRGFPSHAVILPNNDLQLVPVPITDGLLQIDYFRRATRLVNSDDRPAIPEQFHRIIVADALRRYANYDEAAELKTEAMEEYGLLILQLEADQLPGTYTHGATEGGNIVVTPE